MKTNRLLLDAHGDIERVAASDENKIVEFLSQNIRLHRHLDWFDTLDWLGEQPFLMGVFDDRILSILCAANENNEAAWIRAFGVQKHIPYKPQWQNLLNQAMVDLSLVGVTEIASLALNPWFDSLLKESGFSHRQNVIVLELSNTTETKKIYTPNLEIRQMQFDDLSEVYEVDQLAFLPLWQNSFHALKRAFSQLGVHTVASLEGKVVGYQISTTKTIHGHLARLAVHPNFQRRGIAYSLVEDLMQKFQQLGLWRVTVNTQSDNTASLHLYRLFGFTLTGEEIPVFTRRIEKNSAQ